MTPRLSPVAAPRVIPIRSRRRGVALVMTLGAIAVIGALIVGVLFSALLERRAAMEQLLRARPLAYPQPVRIPVAHPRYGSGTRLA